MIRRFNSNQNAGAGKGDDAYLREQKKKQQEMERRHNAKKMEETSSFRCAASYQKFRNYSMYFILSGVSKNQCVIFMIIAMVFHLVMVIIGFIYLTGCPLQPLLPIWCCVAGFAFVFKMFTATMFMGVVRKDVRLTGGVPEKTTIYKSPRYFCLCGIVDICLGILLILGMTLTLPISSCMFHRIHNATDSSHCPTTDYCSPLAYFFSLTSMIFLSVLYGLAYLLGLWAAGCLYPRRGAEEPAGKTIKGFVKNKKTAWSSKKKKPTASKKPGEK